MHRTRLFDDVAISYRPRQPPSRTVRRLQPAVLPPERPLREVEAIQAAPPSPPQRWLTNSK